MRKKRIQLLAVVLVASDFLAACGGSAAESSVVDEETAETMTDNKKEAERKSEPTLKPTEAPMKFDEITVVDNEECVIKITDIDPDNSLGYTVKVYFENRAADKNYMFAVQTAAVNGIEADPFFATTIAAGW